MATSPVEISLISLALIGLTTGTIRAEKLLAKFMKLDRSTSQETLEEAYGFMRAGTERKLYLSMEGLEVQLEIIGETEPGRRGRSNGWI